MDDHRIVEFPDDISDIVSTRYWESLSDGRLQCTLCPRACKMKDGQRGLCFVRKAKGGQVVMTSYGRSSGFCIDPIEKKPLNHFLPGTPVLSLGTAGCNLACSFCQNWDISKAREMDRLQDLALPDMVARAALETGCSSVAFTYNDPVIFMEYAIDIAKACHNLDIKTVAVTAGYMNEAPREEFYQYIDAANVDLKAFSEDFYWWQTKGHLKPVLDTLVYLKERTNVWFEITTLLIPDENDSSKEIEAQCDWIIKNLGPDVPLHFSAFHPDYKMRDKQKTSPATLKRARSIALDKGLHYVYMGNVHDTEGDTTYCPECGKKLIVRDWHEVKDWYLNENGTCLNCGYKISGRFEKCAGDWGRKRVPVRIVGNKIELAASLSKRRKPEDLKKVRSFKPAERTNQNIMETQVAGLFYPDDPDLLASTVDKLLQTAIHPSMSPKALIVPHAGYQYSGAMAARAYNTLGKQAEKIKKIVLFGPPHKKVVQGIAVPTHQVFTTPLGPVPVDQAGVEALLELPFVSYDDDAFLGEHCLEVQLPFLQRVFEKIEIVPALVGATHPDHVATVLDKLWGGDETLVVISSDLSHFHPHDKAKELDTAASIAIESLRIDALKDDQACGRFGIKGLMAAAIKRNMRVTGIDVQNSYQTTGVNKDRVVGYGSYVFEPSETAKTPDEMAYFLLDVAKRVIVKGAREKERPKLQFKNVPRALLSYRSCFATIEIKGQLRGCYGSFIPNKSLLFDVVEQSYNAAFLDNRFRPMNEKDIKKATISLSLLSIPTRFPVEDEADLIEKLKPGQDGLILRDGTQQALFLPSVWDQLTGPRTFVNHLKVKAGWHEKYWSDTMEVYRFTAEKVGPVPIV